MGVNAMKRNILCILLLFGIVVCMTGCNINNIFKTEEEKNDEKCQQIIMAIENHDADALKGLFSKTALHETSDFSEGCDYLFSEYHGTVVSIKRTRYSSNTHYESGKHAREIDCEYEITTSEETYFLYFNDWESNTIDPEKEGLYSVKMVTLEIKDNTENFDPGSRNKRAGIYYPAWDE